ncbi:MAG: GNAT family N-acetyltransferase [Niabella sp.]|nr:MAG: GNAT family N-acetyltransferase [Niabella sp.]
MTKNGVSTQIITPKNVDKYEDLFEKGTQLLIDGIYYLAKVYPRANIELSLNNYTPSKVDGHWSLPSWLGKEEQSILPYFIVEYDEESRTVLSVAYGEIYQEGTGQYLSKRCHVNWIVSQVFKDNHHPNAVGSARRLYEKIISHANQHDCNYVSAGVIDSNEPSLRLHAKLGFTKIPNNEEMANSGCFIRDEKFTPFKNFSGENIYGEEITPTVLNYYWLLLNADQ